MYHIICLSTEKYLYPHLQPTLNLPLTESMIYQVVQPTWHHIRLQEGIFYGLHFGPDSSGSHFSIIVQNILRSLQGKRYITLFMFHYICQEEYFVKVLDINFLYTSSLFDLTRLNIVAKFSKG